MRDENNMVVVLFRLPPEADRALEKAARRDGLTKSAWVRMTVIRALRDAGFLEEEVPEG